MARLYTPREFAELKTEALKMGFRHVESGPLVRSSYHAHEQAASTGLAASAGSQRLSAPSRASLMSRAKLALQIACCCRPV